MRRRDLLAVAAMLGVAVRWPRSPSHRVVSGRRPTRPECPADANVFDQSGALGRQDYTPFGAPLDAAPQPPEQFGGQSTDDEVHCR